MRPGLAYISVHARDTPGVMGAAYMQVKSELARLEDENQRLLQQDRERSERFEDLHRESGSHLGRLDTGLGSLSLRVLCKRCHCVYGACLGEIARLRLEPCGRQVN
jgi:hypothetical protein